MDVTLNGIPLRSISAIEFRAAPAPASRFLRVRCGTGRSFVLPVPREVHTARQANAWTYGLSESEYAPEVRT